MLAGAHEVGLYIGLEGDSERQLLSELALRSKAVSEIHACISRPQILSSQKHILNDYYIQAFKNQSKPGRIRI